ncbi:hypothetical protein [Natronococcus jeotgali]|uniref:Uncharacterized protein n=1 Tax=Natronococcus jeotgali DSM 18795 TaxID=1227498 RepID=L9XJV5_9EURY|nr:hypothetical protein [Natronococcus jeotgali]ELY62039.1 hypothetical protein C492_08550 [Natronococcus jeotgali DSM 18795]
MDNRITLLYENDHFRTIVGTVGILVILVALTEMTLQTAVPLFLTFGSMMAHDVADEFYDLPEGTNWLVYGASIVAVGGYWMVVFPLPWVGGLFGLVGLWFVFDGVTTIRYGPSRTTSGYMSDLETEQWGETMLRMQTLNVIYQALKNADGPRTAPELATDLDLTESRVKRALEFLEHEGRIGHEKGHYHVDPPRWGRLTPIVQFVVWLPRRASRPFRRVTANI